MRLRRGWQLGLLLCLLSGCSDDKVKVAHPWLERFVAFRPRPGLDSLHLEVAVVRQPLDESYLDHDLWLFVDEQKIPPEHKPILEANGLRVGTVSGNLPVGLQKLLSSELSCPDRRQGLVRAGSTLFFPMGPGGRSLPLKVYQDGETKDLFLDQAQCCLTVQAAVLEEEGRTLMKFQPQVQHGSHSLQIRPNVDRSDWSVKQGRPEEKFPQLAFEVPLGITEYVLIGGISNRPHTLGYACFVQNEEDPPARYVMVIRTVKLKPEVLQIPTEPSGTVRALGSPPPLALQSVEPRYPIGPAGYIAADAQFRANSP
jgi:hypothetical protein